MDGMTQVSVSGDGVDRLAKAVYGRKPEPRDYVGGSTAQILYDAAQLIGHLQNEIKKQNDNHELRLKD